jgi:hypothetical protein
MADDIKRAVSLPVVEVVLTAQEMGLLITRVKKDLKSPGPSSESSAT